MALLMNDIKVPINYFKYPAQYVDSFWGTTQQFSLKKNNLALGYDIHISLGTLSGGSSPSWSVSASSPVITHAKIEADNETILDLNINDLQEFLRVTKSIVPNGVDFHIDITDFDLKTKKEFFQTGFPSWEASDYTLYLTFAPLSAVTSGSPSSSSGTQMFLVERDVKRSLVDFQLFRVKKGEVSTSLTSTGYNYLSSFLQRVGAWKLILLNAGSDSLISDLELKLNGDITLISTYWQNLKQSNFAEFSITPDNGYAMIVFQKDNNLEDLLPLGDVHLITDVDLIINANSTGTLTAMYVQYL
jgi:hypothetical protein